MLDSFYRSCVRDPLLQGFYQHSGYLNLGYWHDDTTDAAQAGDQLVDQVLALLGRVDGPVLDVACGLGATTERVALTFGAERTTATNISESQLALARERVPGATFLLMDATSMTFPDAHFDAVLCIEAAFHFRSRRAFLAEALRILRPGGKLAMFDLLFRPGSPGMPHENVLDGAPAYAAQLDDLGWNDIAVESVKAQTLDSYRLRYSDYITANRGATTGAAIHGSQNLLYTNLVLGSLITDCLLVGATKP